VTIGGAEGKGSVVDKRLVEPVFRGLLSATSLYRSLVPFPIFL